MHSKSGNIEIMINDGADEVINERFDSLKNRYQNNLESFYSIHSVYFLYHKYHKINPNRGES